MLKDKMRYVILTLTVAAIVFLTNSWPATAQEANGILKPAEGDILSGAVRVYGVADDPNFAAWQLDLIPREGEQTVMFAGRGTVRQPIPGSLGKIDTGLYPNGAFQLRLRVIRTDGNYTEYFSTVAIDNNTHPLNGITEPAEGVKVGCLVEIRGVANSPNFDKWQVDLLLNGAEDKAILVQRGSAPRTYEGNLGQIDTMQFPDGDHVLRLRIVRLDGNYDSFYTRIAIDNTIVAGAVSGKTCSCGGASSGALLGTPNGITNPEDGTIVSGIVPVCGQAEDPNLLAWQLDLLFDGDESQAVVVAHGNDANPPGASLGMLDTTVLPDGRYGLRLRVGRADDSVDQHTIYICVVNNQIVSGSPAADCAAPPAGSITTP